MGKLLNEFMDKSKQQGITVRWPIGGVIRIPKGVIERNRRVLTTNGEARETLADILRLLCYGVTAESVNHKKEDVVVAQDIAKGILAICGVSMTLDGLVEVELKED